MADISLMQILGFALFVIIGAGLFAIQIERLEPYRWHIFLTCILAFIGTGIIAYVTYEGRPAAVYEDLVDEKKGGGGGGTGGSGSSGGQKKAAKKKSGGGGQAAAGGGGANSSGGGGAGSGNDNSPGSTFSDCADCPDMVVIPPGEVEIGSSADEPGAQPNELPRAQVTFPQKFAVSKYEVRLREFEKFVEETGYTMAGPCNTDGVGASDANFSKPAMNQTPDHPVVCVNMDDAKRYVAWLKKRTQKPYRLMSEGRWEYVRRGVRSTSERDSPSEDMKPDVGNIKDEQWVAQTTPVGSFTSNAFFIFDMMGNVAEWTADCWQADHNTRPADGSPVFASGDCRAHAVRGGSWDEAREMSRPASRRKVPADLRDWRIGFRVMRDMLPDKSENAAASD